MLPLLKREEQIRNPWSSEMVEEEKVVDSGWATAGAVDINGNNAYDTIAAVRSIQMVPSQSYSTLIVLKECVNSKTGLELFLLHTARKPSVPHHRPQLKDVFFPNHGLILFSELLRQVLATLDILRTNEINGNLDAVSHIGDLVELSEQPFRIMNGRLT